MRVRSSLWVLLTGATTVLVACGGGDSETAYNPLGGAGGTAGSAGEAGAAGTAGSSGAAGSGTAGEGGSAGAAGEGGSAGAAGAAGEGEAGAAGEGTAGAAGEGESGAAGEGAAGAAGEGTAGSAGEGTAGAAGEGTAGAAGEGSGGESGEAGSGGSNTCASGILCGDEGACCAEGDECVEGACMAACESSVRCGASNGCCDVGQVCVAEMCTTPGTACIDYSDCEEDEFCEPILGKCLPQQGEPVCLFKPPFEPLAPKLEWSWTGSTIFPTYNQIMDTPLVADIDVDGEPDVIIVTFSSTGVQAYLRALAGRTGTEKWDASAGVYAAGNEVRAASTPALGDIDGDGKIDIVAFQATGGIIAFNNDGSLKWKSTNANGTAFKLAFGESTLGIADLDGDGAPEIFAGGVVLDNTGKLRFNNGAYIGANQSTYGAVSIVADVDGDGKQELLSGRRAYRADGTTLWDNGLTDGYAAIADLDLDGIPELVAIAGGQARVHNAVTGALLAQTTLPGSGAGGPPTIAQFDGVGGPEFASANGTAYSVLHYESQPTPKITVVWNKTTQDMSSNRTGSTVFDFQGDGIAEVIYNDECYLRVYDGPTGNVLFQEPNSSNTSHEYPVVADLFGDNHTKLIVVANDFISSNCAAYSPSSLRHGVFVYGDTNNRWVRTRRIWNQHSYHVTNVKSDGSIPAHEPLSWGPQGFNNYRQSTQGKAVYNAPDLVVSLEAVLSQCPSALRLRAHVKNAGSLGVADGIPVTFYQGTAPDGTYMGDALTPKALLPGESVDVEWIVDLGGVGEANATYYVTVDGQSVSLVDECIETNNTGAIGGVSCGKF